MKKLYEYIHYREYLKDYFEDRKKRDAKFSHRFLARHLGLAAPNFMMLVMQGKRNITRSLACRISEVLKHGDKEADYFENMVGFEQAKTNKEKDRFFSRMLILRRYCDIKKIEEPQYEYYSKWYNVPVRELVTYPDFKGNYKWLAKSLLPAISEPQARHAVALLLKLGLVKKKNKAYERSSRVIATDDEVNSLAIVNFHRKMAEIAGGALDAVPKNERDITSCTVNISEQSVQEIKKVLSEARKKVLSIAEGDASADRVYQLNFQLFPVSVKIGNKRGRV